MSFLYQSALPHNAIQNPAEYLPAHWHRDLPYIRALAECLGFGSGTLARLYEKQGSMKAVWHASEHFLKSILSLSKLEIFLRRRDAGFSEEWLDLWRIQCEGLETTPLGFTDDAYPSLLKEISQFPLLLYVRGNLKALQSERNLAIVGTRRMSDYGRHIVRAAVSDLAPKKPCIVSGLAAGIDTEAHAGALVNGLPTIAVFGCGMDIIYPPKNKGLAEAIVSSNGALVTECDFGEVPTRHSFPRRNRIVAGLCPATLVVEGDIKSGAMITARYALEEGRSVYAVPGRVVDRNAQGPLKLIQQGATPYINAEDLAIDLGWLDVMTKPDGGEKIGTRSEGNSTIVKATQVLTQTSQKQSGISSEQALKQTPELSLQLSTLSEDETRVFDCLSEKPIAVEDVSTHLAWPVARVNECLSILELEGLANFWAGARVSRALAT